MDSGSTSDQVTERLETTHTVSWVDRRAEVSLCQRTKNWVFLLGPVISASSRALVLWPFPNCSAQRRRLPLLGSPQGKTRPPSSPALSTLCTDFKREFPLFSVSQFVVVIFLSPGLTDTPRFKGSLRSDINNLIRQVLVSCPQNKTACFYLLLCCL